MQRCLTRLCAFVIVVYLGPPIAAAQSAELPQNRSLGTTQIVATDHFAFHSDPWINLHHFLYQWSREDRGFEIGRHPVPMPERSTVGELSAADQTAWLSAVGFYRNAVASRGNFDWDMMRIKARLVFLDDDPFAAPADIIPGIANALRAAMPIYRKKWWLRHDEANRRWIGNILQPLRRHEAAFVHLTRRVRESKWPDVPWRVDVTAYPNYRAGYTTREGHIIMFSTDPKNQDLYSLEIVLHEVQHAELIQGTMPTQLPMRSKRRARRRQRISSMRSSLRRRESSYDRLLGVFSRSLPKSTIFAAMEVRRKRRDQAATGYTVKNAGSPQYPNGAGIRGELLSRRTSTDVAPDCTHGWLALWHTRWPNPVGIY